MKLRCLALTGLFAACLLAGCGAPVQEGPASSAAPAPTPAAESAASSDAPQSTSSPTAPTPDSMAESGTESPEDTAPGGEEDAASTEGLIKYDSIYDIPFIDLALANDGKDLNKNGQPWASTPGTQRFGTLCFSDGTTLYIQCFLSEDQDDGFRWYWVCFDHWHEDAVGFLPEETYNKLFTHADGYTLYTDDGYEYTVSPCDWE